MNTSRASIASHIRHAQTPAEELRAILGQLEAGVGRLGVSGTERPAEILTQLDRATELLDALSQHGGNLAGEQARLHTITQQLYRKGKAFLSGIGGADTLRSLRAHTNPPPDNWWWTIDERLAADRQARRRRTIRTLGVAVVAVAALSLLYTLFLAPDEATRERYRHEQQAETALMQGDLELALSEVESALAHAPGNGELLILRGVVLQMAGRSDEAEQDFTAVRQTIESPETFYSTRAQAYLMAGAADRALEDTERMLELNPESALAYFQMGNVNATLGNLLEANRNYEEASRLAAAAGQSELEAMSRVQLANLMLMMSAPQLPETTPAP